MSVLDETDIRPLRIVEERVEGTGVPDDNLKNFEQEVSSQNLAGESGVVSELLSGQIVAESLEVLIINNVLVALVMSVDEVLAVVSDGIPKLETIISVEIVVKALSAISVETSLFQFLGETVVKEVELLPDDTSQLTALFSTNGEGAVSEGLFGLGNKGKSGTKIDTDGVLEMGKQKISQSVAFRKLSVDGNRDGFVAQMGNGEMVTELMDLDVSAGDEHLGELITVLMRSVWGVDGGVFGSFNLNSKDVESSFAIISEFLVNKQDRGIEVEILVVVELFEVLVINDKESLFINQVLNRLGLVSRVSNGQVSHLLGDLLHILDDFDQKRVNTLKILLAEFLISVPVVQQKGSHVLFSIISVSTG